MGRPDLASLMELPDSASLGPMGPLLRQLDEFAKNNNNPAGNQELMDELGILYASFEDVYKAEDPGHVARWWMKELRNLVHEIKDYSDEAARSLIPEDLKGLKASVRAVSDRAKKYQLPARDFKQAATPDLTLRLPVPAAPIEDLVKLLAFGDEKAKQLRVVTLFGFAGAVNTSAARTMYDFYGGRFECRAFVRVSQDPDMRSIFTSILLQIKAPPDDGFSDVDKLIRSVHSRLQDKRYLIVIDDIWTIPDHNFITGAFPGGHYHSRIIATTQTKDVAFASCDSYLQKIFEMTPLNDDDSGRNTNHKSIKDELNRIYHKLSPELKTCLLYLNMYQAGYTIRKDDLVKQWMAEGFLPAKNWAEKKKLAGEYFDKLVGAELIQPVERNYNNEVMSCTVEQIVLDMIANESKEVNFIATVKNNSEMTTFSPARRLSVQFRGEVNAKIPRNIVLTKVRSVAFSGFLGCVPSLVGCKLLQVLILHIWADKDAATYDLSRISELLLLRYVKIACKVTVNLPAEIGRLKDLETLEIYARAAVVPSDVTSLPRLLHLSLPSANLPTNVIHMSSLRTLECFDLSRNTVEQVKALCVELNLEVLHLTGSEAHDPNLQKKMDAIWCWIFTPDSSLKTICVVPTGSDHVNSAFVNIEDPGADARFTDTSPSVLERLEISPRVFIFSGLPKGLSELGQLCILKIAVRKLSWADIAVLKRLPALTALSLYVWITFGGDRVGPAHRENQEKDPERITFGKDGFPVLTYFKITCPTPCLDFLPGAMPSVRRLKLRFNASGMREYSLQDARLEHLTGLQEISIKIGKDSGFELNLWEAKSALESAFPVPPIVNMKSVDHLFCAQQPERADRSSLPLKSSSYQQNPGLLTNVASAIRCMRDLRVWFNFHREVAMKKLIRTFGGFNSAVAMQILIYIIGEHNNFKIILREKEQMTIIIEGNNEDSQGVSKEKWILQLQELVYDIENFIYNSSRMKMTSSFKHVIPWKMDMKDLKGRIKTLKKWGHAAQWDQSGDGTATTTSAPLGFQTPCYTPESDLIGLDGPKRELMGLMYQEDMQLRVISIVGCGGLGKSTLARAVYKEIYLEGHFKGFAWVVASDSNSSEDLLNKIHQQLVHQQLVPEEISNITPDDYMLRRILSEQRYFLVIDQVQQAEVWHGIKNAFPKCNNGSRIIVTTSILSVAAVAAATTNNTRIYKMPTLGDEDSKTLFWKTFYGPDTEPAPVQADGSENIFKKCDGLPLSLLSMARYFSHHHGKGKIGRYGRFLGGAPEALGKMNSVLAQCYNSLPDNVHRACLLSLSIFPHGHQINRKSITRRWVAEGLVTGDINRNGEEVAADCFNELIDRNIIESVLIGNNSSVKRCRIHGLMLEYIVKKAISRNYVTLIHKDEAFPNKQDHLVRRLSVQDGAEGSGRVATKLGLSVVRSISIFNSVLFDLQSCKVLQILDLEGCTGIKDAVLHAVCQLRFLKYLSLRGSDVGRIPKRIKTLQQLETLDLRETGVEELPIEVIMLPCLAHLFGKFDLPRELKNEKKTSKLEKFLSEESRLQTLSGFIMDKNSGYEAIILDARSLRKVKIWCTRYSGYSSQHILVSSLNKRFTADNGALESLSIDLGTYASTGFLHSLESPRNLSSMKLSGQIGKLPDFMTSPESNLTELQLSSTCLGSDELSLLQKLRCLLYLKLYEDRWGFGNGNFVVHSGGFPSLKRLWFEAPTIPELDIKQGATTKLDSLYLLCPEYPPSRLKGIEHLQHLNEVVLHDSLGASELEVWKETAKKHENRPRVTKQAESS